MAKLLEFELEFGAGVKRETWAVDKSVDKVDKSLEFGSFGEFGV